MSRRKRQDSPVATRPRSGGVDWTWEDRSWAKDHELAPAGLQAAYVNGLYSVQVFRKEAADGLVMTHLMIRRHDTLPIRSWADMQRIKDELCGPDRVGVEVYPPRSDLVDQANIYHLWIFPAGVRLGFGLEP